MLVGVVQRLRRKRRASRLSEDVGALEAPDPSHVSRYHRHYYLCPESERCPPPAPAMTMPEKEDDDAAVATEQCHAFTPGYCGCKIRPGHSDWCKCPSSEARAAQERRRAALEAGAAAQLQSPIFALLPVEVRGMVFDSLWRVCGYEYGIHIAFDGRRKFFQMPCVTDLDAGSSVAARSDDGAGGGQTEDAAVDASRPIAVDSTIVSSVWFNHWQCDAEAERGRLRRHKQSPFMPVLLTCKRFYIEATRSLFQSLTFIFANRWVPLKFIAHSLQPSFYHLRSINLIINFWNAGFAEQECLWATLAELPCLREVRIWLNQEPIPVAAYAGSSNYNKLSKVSVQDVLSAVGPELAPKVVLDLPVVNGVAGGYTCRGYDLEGAPFRVRYHPRAAFVSPRLRVRTVS